MEEARPSPKASLAFWSVLFLLGGIGILLLMEWFLFPLTVDDAYISYHFANNLADGHGLVWHPGVDPVEGFTNFLWVVILSLSSVAGFDVVVTAKLLGVIFSVASVIVMYRIVRRINTGALGVMPAILLAATPAFALWSVSGLETSLFIFLLILALYQYLVEEDRLDTGPQRYWSVFWFMLLAMTRPEGAVVFIFLVGLRLVTWSRRDSARRELKSYLRWLIPVVLVGLAYFLWRWNYFGYPLPNTFYVKAQSGPSQIARQIGVYLLPYAYRIFPFILLALFAVGASRVLPKFYVIIGTALASLAMVNLFSSDWMPGHRLALPMTPLIYLLAYRPLESLLKRVFLETKLRQKITYGLTLAGLVLFAALPFLYTAPLFNRVMATQMDMSIYRWAEEMQTIVDGQYARIGSWLAENAPEDCSVVAGNVGAIAYLSECNVIDQIGLTSEHIARNGWTVDYLLSLDPDFIVIESDTPDEFGGLYGTGGERWMKDDRFLEGYEMLFVLDNGRTDEAALFIHHLPHATWLFARKDLNLAAGFPVN
jgi:hypothetical protein